MLSRLALAAAFGTATALAALPAAADPLPGAAPAPELQSLAGIPAVSPPRTRYIAPDGTPVYRNRLILERSPYLRQHAHNPVNWFPWGDAALAEAARRDVPVFLSVGYATCHWCHVMEEESFDNSDVAGVLNRHYVAVKVDRETLPHIDAQYMLATQILDQRGGWPNNVFLMPNGEPIVAMGYAPPETFRMALLGMADDWRSPDGRTAMREQAASVAELVRLISLRRTAAAEVDETVFEQATADSLASHDDFEGGFGQAPKFPNETTILFLLDRYERTGDRAALDAATTSLRHMVAGGIHDHVGGGFHRYATDSQWLTPHFEKMLYNQALVGQALVQAWQLTGDPSFERAARRAFDYVLRDMTAPGGGFFAAQDADSRVTPGGAMEEGAFYTWTPDQAAAALGADEPAGRAMLNLDRSPTVPTGSIAHLDPAGGTDFARLDPMLERLRVARDSRPRPLTDTKVIAGWNGLMIRTLAEASVAFDEPRYLAAARRAHDFVTARMLDAGGGLARAYADGPLEEGSLRDYAWLGLGALALHDATGEGAYLATAARLADQIGARFSDGSGAALRLSQDPGPLGGSYDVIEGATPTGNASALALYSRLSRRIADDARAVAYRDRADTLLGALAVSLKEAPGAQISAIDAAALHLKGETGPSRPLGNGVARARLSVAGDTVHMGLDFAPGWHANSDRPLNPDLIPTSLTGIGLSDLRYPPARSVTLGFQSEPLSVIDGRTAITARRAPGGGSADLTIQICNDVLCLPPERVTFRLPGQ